MAPSSPGTNPSTRLLTSSGLDLDVALAVHQLGQWAAQAEWRHGGARLFAPVEHAPVAVLLGQARQSINVEVDLSSRGGFVRLVSMVSSYSDFCAVGLAASQSARGMRSSGANMEI